MKEKKGNCQFLLKWLTANVCLPRKYVRARQDRNSFDWADYVGTRLSCLKYNLQCTYIEYEPAPDKPTILQCMYDQQRLGSVCASTHYIKQASRIAGVYRRCILYDRPRVWSECAIAVSLLIPLWTAWLSKVNTISECSDLMQLRRLTRVFASRTRHFVTITGGTSD